MEAFNVACLSLDMFGHYSLKKPVRLQTHPMKQPRELGLKEASVYKN